MLLVVACFQKERFRFKEQAILPKQGLEIKINQGSANCAFDRGRAGRANGSKKIVYWTSM
jgi:hypothetical protein